MKKVLILFDKDKTNIDGPAYYTEHPATANCVRVLETLHIPFDIGWTVTVQPADATDYALVIVPECSEVNGDYNTWLDGSLSVPVFCAYSRYTLNSGAFKSGATVRETTSSAASLTSSWGSIGYGPGNYIYTLDGTDTNVTNLIYDPSTEKSAFWKRTGVANDVYYWAASGYQPLALCHVLAQVYTAQEVLWPLFIDVDHPDDADDATGRANLLGFVEWLRARSAVCASGIKRCTTAAEWATASSAMQAIIKENQDVMIPQLHSHTSGHNFWREVGGEDFGTLAKKLAEQAAQKAVMATAGVTIADNGSLGYQFLPMNAVSFLGLEAMAALGVRTWRATTDVGYHPFATGNVPNNVLTLHIVDGETVRVVGRAGYLATKYDATTAAAEYAAQGAATLTEYRVKLHLTRLTSILQYDAPILHCHGTNFTGENPGQMFLDVMDVIVQAASPIIRWASREDLAAMAELYRRQLRT